MTAQENYKFLLNKYISPALRAAGFKGSGGKYSLSNAQAFILLGFQKDRRNTTDEVKCTINVSVISKKKWAVALKKHPWMGQSPLSNAEYPTEMWIQRLAMIQEGAGDKWWTITSTSNVADTAQDILSRIKRDALPAIKEHVARL